MGLGVILNKKTAGYPAVFLLRPSTSLFINREAALWAAAVVGEASDACFHAD